MTNIGNNGCSCGREVARNRSSGDVPSSDLLSAAQLKQSSSSTIRSSLADKTPRSGADENKKRNTVNYCHYEFHSHTLNQPCIINRNNQKQYGVSNSNLTRNFDDGGGVSLSLARCESDTKILPFFRVWRQKTQEHKNNGKQSKYK